MLDNSRQTRIAHLQERLAELDARLDEEMRRRGFDPAQADNLALPSALANLSVERAQLEVELEELIAENETGEEAHGN